MRVGCCAHGPISFDIELAAPPVLIRTNDGAGRRRLQVSEEELLRGETTVLQDRLEKLHHRIATLERRIDETPEYGLGKGDPRVTDWELAKALLEQLQERVASTEEALSRARCGTYGICERCGGEIDPERMTVLPDTKLCIGCARETAQGGFGR
jgi:RNA polymerase-binding transcription factor DksA